MVTEGNSAPRSPCLVFAMGHTAVSYISVCRGNNEYGLPKFTSLKKYIGKDDMCTGLVIPTVLPSSPISPLSFILGWSVWQQEVQIFA